MQRGGVHTEVLPARSRERTEKQSVNPGLSFQCNAVLVVRRHDVGYRHELNRLPKAARR